MGKVFLELDREQPSEQLPYPPTSFCLTVLGMVGEAGHWEGLVFLWQKQKILYPEEKPHGIVEGTQTFEARWTWAQIPVPQFTCLVFRKLPFLMLKWIWKWELEKKCGILCSCSHPSGRAVPTITEHIKVVTIFKGLLLLLPSCYYLDNNVLMT